MKRLQDFTVKSSKVEGRVQLTLQTADDTLQCWLAPEEADGLAAAILQARFQVGQTTVEAPKRKRRGRVFLTLQSEPRPLKHRPSFSEQLMKLVEKNHPAIFARVKEAQERWDKREAKRRARVGPYKPYYFGEERSEEGQTATTHT